MKYFSGLVLSALFAITAVAQRVQIGSPAHRSTISAGAIFTVEVDRPDFQSSAQEVAIVLGITSCATGSCAPPTETMGFILYSGPYNPKLVSPVKPPYENFTVSIPSHMKRGKAQLNLMHVSLIGASLSPFLETTNITLSVV